MKSLFNLLHSVRPLSPAFQAFLEQHVEVKHYKKNEVILQEGNICKTGSFIAKGIVCGLYYLEDKDKKEKLKEVCNKIYSQNDVLISVYSFLEQRASYERFVCIHDTTLASLTHEQIQHCYEAFPEFNYIIRVLIQKYYAKAELRLYNIRKRTAQERYDLFLETYKKVVAYLPSHIIASYIGVDEATFSRLKSS